MIRLALIAAVLLSAGPARADVCQVRGYRLWGRVQLVDAFPDVRARVVDSPGLAQLRVRLVDAFAEACGEWQIVDHGPALRVQLVEAHEDIRIAYVGGWEE